MTAVAAAPMTVSPGAVACLIVVVLLLGGIGWLLTKSRDEEDW